MEADKTRVLFLCTGNSARSQMAEALLCELGGERFAAHSAGLEPKGVNPHSITVMRESGISLDGHSSKDVQLYIGQQFDYVITLCDHAADTCPSFPGAAARLHWSFPDPALATGDEESQLAEFRAVRDAIKERMEQWLQQLQTEAGENA